MQRTGTLPGDGAADRDGQRHPAEQAMHVSRARRVEAESRSRRRHHCYALLLVSLVLACTSARSGDPLAGSRQKIVVTTANWNTTAGTLQRYERDGDAWREVGAAIPVVVGRTGLSDRKREGDGKSPAGVFPIGTLFGFAPSADFAMPYRQLRDTTECVDDTASRFYNRIVDRDQVKVDWSSSEKMRSVGEYVWGAVVDYNTPPVAGKGSCIFLHVWGGPQSTTAGCTAMREEDLLTVLHWLDPAKKPMLVQNVK